MRRDIDQAITRIADRQWGVFHWDQARRAGADGALVKRRTAAGLWVRVFPGVYRLAAMRVGWEQKLMALALYGGNGALISHRAAGALYGLDGIGRRPPVEVTIPRRRQLKIPDGQLIHVHRDSVRGDAATIRRLPVTAPARTILDLAAVLPGRNQLELAYESARTKGLLDDDRLIRRLAAATTHRRAGLEEIRMMLERRDIEVKDSTMETMFVQLLRDLGLPPPELHVRVSDDEGNFIAEIDAAYCDLNLYWELDSWKHHGHRTGFETDRDKANRMLDAGKPLRSLTWRHLTIDRARTSRRIVNAYRRATTAAPVSETDT